MELYQLKYFLYAAKYENVSKASQELRVAQPSISKAIAALERELRVQLFERNGKRIELTYAGKVLRENIAPLLWRLNELPMELRSLGEEMDIIHLNALSAVPLMADIIKKFKEEEVPNATFVVTDRREMTDWDICICSASPKQSYTYGTELLKERVFLGVSNNSWLREYDRISLNEVRDENFILLPRGTVLRQLADIRFREHGFIPKIAAECDSIHLVWKLVDNNAGIALWPECSWGTDKGAHMVEIKEEGFLRSIFLLRKRTGEMTKAAFRFAQYVEDYMRTLDTDRARG